MPMESLSVLISFSNREENRDERGYMGGERAGKERESGRFSLTVATRFLTLGAATILSCLLISLGMQQFRQAKQIANIANRRMSEFALYLSQDELTAYDGIFLNGSDVVNFYRRFLYERADFSMVVVKGKVEYLIPSGGQTDLLTQPIQKTYCRPSAQYRCEVLRNVNEVILQVRFIEQ